MDGKILDPDGARERLAAWKGRIDKLAADTQAMSDRLSGLRVTARDPSGLAEVTIDSTGTLVQLELTDRMRRSAPAAVAAAIMAAVAEAKNQLAERSQEIITETVGTNSAAARAIADSVERRLRGGAAAERAAGSGGQDDDYEARSYLGRR
jgi:DNA-binding protein YbaB